MKGFHKSVLLKEAVGALIPARLSQDGLVGTGSPRYRSGEAGGNDCHAPERHMAWYLDCTLGDGGHSIEIIVAGGKVIGMDVDPEALKRARQRFNSLGIKENKYKLVQGNFRDVENLILQTDTAGQIFAGAKSDLAGAIFDLGVSSLQLENPQRGFSFAREGPLDMRMDPGLGIKAADLLKALSRKELYELFTSLGEEKYSWRLADVVVRAREVAPFTTTSELAEKVSHFVRPSRTSRDKHPATRVFQALRMAVNDELGALQEGLEKVKNLIKRDGRIVVISFHSLEDRIVKNTFKQWEETGVGEILTKKPLVPTDLEIADNPRSRSAKMRVFKII